MVETVDIRKVQARDRLVVDVDVWMAHPDDFDFSPRISVVGQTLRLSNAGEDEINVDFELEEKMVQIAERDRSIDLRVKFQVRGMHGVLTDVTPNPRDATITKKLAEPRWKTTLPLIISPS